MSTDVSKSPPSEGNKIKLALIKSLVRQPCACVFPYLSLIKKSGDLNIENVMNQIKECKRQYPKYSSQVINDILYVETVKEFCREYTEIKTNFDKAPGIINNLLAYVELLCLYIKFSFLELYKNREKSLTDVFKKISTFLKSNIENWKSLG
jgi:hypothetical protein